MTLSEVVVSSAINVIVAGSVIFSAVTLHRAATATEHFAEAQVYQTRIADLLDIDLRRAMTVQTHSDERIVSMTLPDFYNPDGTAKVPTIVGNHAIYGDPNNPVQVIYMRSGTNVIRREIIPSQGIQRDTTIARNVDDFQFNLIRDRQNMEVSATFIPRFSKWGGGVDETVLRTNSAFSSRTFLRNLH